MSCDPSISKNIVDLAVFGVVVAAVVVVAVAVAVVGGGGDVFAVVVVVVVLLPVMLLVGDCGSFFFFCLFTASQMRSISLLLYSPKNPRLWPQLWFQLHHFVEPLEWGVWISVTSKLANTKDPLAMGWFLVTAVHLKAVLFWSILPTRRWSVHFNFPGCASKDLPQIWCGQLWSHHRVLLMAMRFVWSAFYMGNLYDNLRGVGLMIGIGFLANDDRSCYFMLFCLSFLLGLIYRCFKDHAAWFKHHHHTLRNLSDLSLDISKKLFKTHQFVFCYDTLINKQFATHILLFTPIEPQKGPLRKEKTSTCCSTFWGSSC